MHAVLPWWGTRKEVGKQHAGDIRVIRRSMREKLQKTDSHSAERHGGRGKCAEAC
jgi:hypothetical protein